MEQDFLNQLKATDEVFEGWDFSYVSETGRIATSLLTWSYGSIVKSKMASATSMLDMGTGGGELLSYLRPYPQHIKATEGYQPNVSVAKNRLEPLGVTVLPFEEDHDLPLENEEFDLIINRHDSFDATEVNRILKSGGTFITQQVGGDDCREINEWFNVPVSYEGWNLEKAENQLKGAGLRVVTAKEEFPTQRFYDLGALLYYLKAIPWQLEGWKQEDHEDELYQIYLRMKKEGYIDVAQHRFLLICEKL